MSRRPTPEWQRRELAKLWPSTGYKWALEWVAEEEGCLKARGWAMAPPDQRKRLRFTCDGELCDAVDYPTARPDIEQAFPHLRDARECGYTCTIRLNSADDPRRDHFTLRCIDTNTGQSLGGGDRPAYYVRRSENVKLPDPTRILRVAGFGSPEAFHFQGYNLFRQLDDVLRQSINATLADFPRVLDWGCGSGRVALHFAPLPGVHLTGVDVDADSINWCQQNLPFGEFMTIPLHPPTSLPSESFDLVIGLSVFTHLREDVAISWLAELQRVAKRNAILLLTYHGKSALAVRGNLLKPDQLRTLHLNGFLDLPDPTFDAILKQPGYYRAVFHQDGYIRRQWSKFFDLVELRSAAVGVQDVAVLRKR